MITDGLCKKIPYPLLESDQDVLKRAEKNIASARSSGVDMELSNAIMVLDMVTLDLRESIGVLV